LNNIDYIFQVDKEKKCCDHHKENSHFHPDEDKQKDIGDFSHKNEENEEEDER
jgi:hypothetical protein